MYNPHASFQSAAQPPAQQIPATPTPESPGKQALCCAEVQAHRPIWTRWETQFNAFLAWLEHNGKREATHPSQLDHSGDLEFVIRVTTTINFGRMCGYMDYGLVRAAEGNYFQGIPPTFARGQGFLTRVAFKNYACQKHNLYFQLDMFTSRPTATTPAQ